MKNILSAATLFVAPLFFAASAQAELHCRPCPYTCGEMGIGDDHCSYRPSNQPGFCCVDLDKKGLSQALAWEEYKNNNLNQGYNNNGYNNNAASDRCPPGFSPSEQKCSPQERRAGCKDIRLPSGLGCVNRRR